MFTLFDKAEAKYDKIFFDLNIKNIDGKIINFSEYNDKVILLVNVASKCGFTKQYTNLQKLWETYKDKGLVVLGVPSNQFGGQEPGTNKDIKSFCEINFNITFPLTDKVYVKGEKAHDIYKWAKKNYGKSTIPKWNFHKILINREGKIHDTFSSFTEPTSKKNTNKIEKIFR
jgi:glutathione peroxidase